MGGTIRNPAAPYKIRPFITDVLCIIMAGAELAGDAGELPGLPRITWTASISFGVFVKYFASVPGCRNIVQFPSARAIWRSGAPHAEHLPAFLGGLVVCNYLFIAI